MQDVVDASTLRVVVLSSHSSAGQRAIVQSIADAIAQGQRSEVQLPTRSVSAAPESLAEGLLAEADAAVALDAGSLRRAMEAGVPLCAAVLPTFDTAWSGELSDADCVFAAHDALLPDLLARGARSEALFVTGPVRPKGFLPSKDRAAQKRKLGMPDVPVVLLPTTGLDAMDLGVALTQLAKVNTECCFLFDVGDDADAAIALRREVPGRLKQARMFADREGSAEYWQLADVVIARARGCDAMQALSVDATLLIPAPGRSDTRAANILKDAGVATVLLSTRELGDAISEAVRPNMRSKVISAIQGLQIGAGAERLNHQLRVCWEAGREMTSFWPRGLPKGLETL